MLNLLKKHHNSKMLHKASSKTLFNNNKLKINKVIHQATVILVESSVVKILPNLKKKMQNNH